MLPTVKLSLTAGVSLAGFTGYTPNRSVVPGLRRPPEGAALVQRWQHPGALRGQVLSSSSSNISRTAEQAIMVSSQWSDLEVQVK